MKWVSFKQLKLLSTVTGFGPKMGQIGPKWDKSGTFSDQISVHFGTAAPKLLKSDLKK